MTKEDIISAAATFKQISLWQNAVSRERFCKIAATKFGIVERDADTLYCLFSTARQSMNMINSEYDRDNVTANLPLALIIAEEAYNIYHNNRSVPGLPVNAYYKRDKRRYFIADTSDKDNIKRFAVEVNLLEKADIVAFAELLQREGVEVKGVTHILGQLEHKGKADNEHTDYYEGDIVFVFGNPADSLWRSWYKRKDGGVFLATDKGWRKLLYTPGRGYVDRKGYVEFESEDCWNEYMIEGLADAKDWRYVGNIHDDLSVLVDKGFDVAPDDNNNE